MDPNALYAALNTVAQCAAALAALIGFLGLWRLDRLREEEAQIWQELGEYTFGPSARGSYRPLDLARINLEAERMIDNPEPQEQDKERQLQIKVLRERRKALPRERQQLMDVLQRFLRRTLVILALAISGLVAADALHSWVLTRWLTGLLIIVAAYRLWRDTYAVVREAARSIRLLGILALLMCLATPALATPRCTTYEEKTLGRLQTLCDDGTRAVSTWNKTLSRWESTVTSPPTVTPSQRAPRRQENRQ